MQCRPRRRPGLVGGATRCTAPPGSHVVDRDDRVAALREAGRVRRPGGVVVAAAISRWASTADGICAGYLRDPRFAEVVERDVRTGVHENRARHPGWFATAWRSRPEELVAGVGEAGPVPDGPVAVEGLGGTATDLDAMLDDPGTRCAPAGRDPPGGARAVAARGEPAPAGLRPAALTPPATAGVSAGGPPGRR